MKKLMLFFLLSVVMIVVISCYNDNLSEMTPSSGVPGGSCDTTGVITYSGHVALIMKSNCGSANSCHSSRNTSGYDLSTYQDVKAVTVNGKLISSISWTGSATRMPESGPMTSDCNINRIQKWINAGALNN